MLVTRVSIFWSVTLLLRVKDAENNLQIYTLNLLCIPRCMSDMVSSVKGVGLEGELDQESEKSRLSLQNLSSQVNCQFPRERLQLFRL